MRYQKIKKNLIRLSVFTLLIHSEAVFSIETIEGKKIILWRSKLTMKE